MQRWNKSYKQSPQRLRPTTQTTPRRRYCDLNLSSLSELRLNYDISGQLATASKNIKIAISRINYAWNLQNSPIFRLPDHLILRIFEHLQDLTHETPSRTHPKWWDWLNVTSVCRAWRRISVEGSSLWENVRIHRKMPVPFLSLILERAGGGKLAVSFRSRDYLHSAPRREGYFKTIQPIAGRIKSFAIHVTVLAWYRERDYLTDLFVIPQPNLESLDLSYNAFHASSSRHARSQGLYRPDLSDMKDRVVLQLITLIPTNQLKHLTLRHMKGWPPTRFGNLTDLTLFGYADGNALAEAVPANPTLQKLKLESIKHKERYSYDSNRLVNLDGQTLELARCDPGVLSMFTLSSTCSLVITRTMDHHTTAYEGVEAPETRWLPEDISRIRCLHELEEVHLSVTRIPRRRGWVASEQKTVGYSTSNPTSGSRPQPSVTFILTYHSDTRTPGYKVPFESKYLLRHPIPWGKVTRASFDGFHDQFTIRRSHVILDALPNLRSLIFRRCDSVSLLRFIADAMVQGLERLQFEDELCGRDFGDRLSRALKIGCASVGRLKELKIIVAGDPSSTITAEQIGKLEECVCRIEVAKAPSYRPVGTDV